MNDNKVGLGVEMEQSHQQNSMRYFSQELESQRKSIMQAIKELYSIYGSKESDIRRGLKDIYGIRLSRGQIQYRLRRIEPDIDYEEFNQEQLIEVWDKYKQIGDNWNVIKNEYFPKQVYMQYYTTSRPKHMIQDGVHRLFKKHLKKLNQLVGINKAQNATKLRTVSISVLNDITRLNRITREEKDQLFNDVVQSCKTLLSLVDILLAAEGSDEGTKMRLVLKKVTKDQMQTIFEHLFLIQRIYEIASSKIQPVELLSIDKQQRKVRPAVSKRQPKTWEEAETEAFLPREKVEGKLPIPELNLEEINLIKESVLYKILKTTDSKFFYDVYHEALSEFYRQKDMYTVVFSDDKNARARKAIKKTAHPAAPAPKKTKPLWKIIKEKKEQFTKRNVFNKTLYQDINDENDEFHVPYD